MHSSVAKMSVNDAPRSTGISAVRMLTMLALAFGYVSTMARGPGTAEYGRVFGYDPSWHGTNVLFIFAGYFVLKTLNRHGSVVKMLKARARRNLVPVTIFAIIVVSIIFPLLGKPAATFGETFYRLADYAFGLITCTDPGALLPGLLDDAKYMCSMQGAIWTLRWGAFAYLVTAIAWPTGVLKKKTWTFTLAATGIIAYILALQNYVFSWVSMPDEILVPLRLGAMFCMGLGAYSFVELKGIQSRKTIILGALICLAIAIFNDLILPWTPIIEVLSAFGFALSAVALSKIIDKSRFGNIPLRDVSIWIFLIHWPAAQLLLVALPNLTSWTLIALTLPLTLILSVIMSKATEAALFLQRPRRTAQA